MQFDLSLQLDLRDPLQRLSQDSSLALQLSLVRNMLVMTSATPLKIRTTRFHPFRRLFDQLRNRSPREACLPGRNLRFDVLTRQHEWHEHGHTAAVRVCRRTSQAVAAVNQFFNAEKHDDVGWFGLLVWVGHSCPTLLRWLLLLTLTSADSSKSKPRATSTASDKSVRPHTGVPTHTL